MQSWQSGQGASTGCFMYVARRSQECPCGLDACRQADQLSVSLHDMHVGNDAMPKLHSYTGWLHAWVLCSRNPFICLWMALSAGKLKGSVMLLSATPVPLHRHLAYYLSNKVVYTCSCHSRHCSHAWPTAPLLHCCELHFASALPVSFH